MAKTFTDQNFKEEVLGASLPVLVDFYADSCGPCKMMAPVIEKLAEEYAGKVEVGKLNVDTNQRTAQEYGVMSIPTILLFVGGEKKAESVGAVPEKELKQKIEEVIGK